MTAKSFLLIMFSILILAFSSYSVSAVSTRITINVNTPTIYTNGSAAVSGHAELSNGTIIANNAVNISLNGTKISGDVGMLNLSGGTGGQSGSYLYTAPDGTTLTSTVPVWTNDAYYYMGYLFDGSVAANQYNNMWLGNGGDAELTFDFKKTHALSYVRVYPIGRTDLHSSYKIYVSNDGASWTNITSWIVTTSLGSGQYIDTQISGTYRYVKFGVTAGTWAPALCEIQFYKQSVATNQSGNYAYTFKAPSLPGVYPVKASTSYNGNYGENTTNINVLANYMKITASVSRTPAYTNSPVSISGHIELADGTPAANSPVKLYLNGVRFLRPAAKLNLAGGTRVWLADYTAPDGTKVTSTAPTYSSDPNYYLNYLFDGSYGTAPTNYWLTSSDGNQFLTFNFTKAIDLSYVRVYPYSRSDARSDYKVYVSSNGASWTNITSWINTAGIGAGQYVDTQINSTYQYVKFELTKIGSWGVTLNEVEFYVHPAIMTNSSGNYAYTFTPSAGTYAVKANATYRGIYGENSTSMNVLTNYMKITTSLNSTTALPGAGVSVSGHIDLADGRPAANNAVGLWINGNRMQGNGILYWQNVRTDYNNKMWLQKKVSPYETDYTNVGRTTTCVLRTDQGYQTHWEYYKTAYYDYTNNVILLYQRSYSYCDAGNGQIAAGLFVYDLSSGAKLGNKTMRLTTVGTFTDAANNFWKTDGILTVNETTRYAKINFNDSTTADYTYPFATASKTDANGDYGAKFTAPSSPGVYTVKANATYSGLYGENSTNLQVSNIVWRSPPDITDPSGDATEMDVIKVERGLETISADKYEHFKTTFADATLKTDSFKKKGWMKLLLEGEEQSGKWCVYIWNKNSDSKLHVKLSRTTATSNYCDGSATYETVISDVAYDYLEGATFSAYDYVAGKGFEIDTVNDFMTVMFKSGPSELVGTDATGATTDATGVDKVGETPPSQSGIEGENGGGVPEFSPIGVIAAIIGVVLVVMLLKGTKKK